MLVKAIMALDMVRYRTWCLLGYLNHRLERLYKSRQQVSWRSMLMSAGAFLICNIWAQGKQTKPKPCMHILQEDPACKLWSGWVGGYIFHYV